MDTMEEAIPVQDSLDRLYPMDALLTQTKRWGDLVTQFASKFGRDPTFVARSPGRVNIIGEHIDYSLYDVLPMGIAADVIIAVAVNPVDASSPADGASISLANVDSEKHKPLDFAVSGTHGVEIDASTHAWTSYFKAGMKGALSHLAETNPSFKPVSFAAMVDGTVPAGGGLSSSAAFVCASALATLHANGSRALTKKTLTELAIVSERAVGVNSGGMDQAASVCSVRGQALHVSFSPHLRAEAIAFPKLDPPVTFMIAQSLVTSDKQVTAPVCYNLRVVEVTLAAAYLAACFGLELPKDSGPLHHSLRGFEDAYSASEHAAGKPADSLSKARRSLELAREHLSQTQGYTRGEIAARLGISEAELATRFLHSFPIRAERFLLRQRAEHVFGEVLRVHEFIALLKQNKATTASEGVALLQKMGSLMNETQDSCRDLYDCSCPELDQLCQLARGAGAYGSRLTGAGWGGCSVHLVPRDRVDKVRQAWIDGYYRKEMQARWEKMGQDERDSCIVVTEPGVGSVVMELGK